MKVMEAVKAIRPLATAAPTAMRKPVKREVDIHDRDDFAMWCRRLGVTPLQLCSVIDRVGSDAIAVENAIRSRKRAA